MRKETKRTRTLGRMDWRWMVAIKTSNKRRKWIGGGAREWKTKRDSVLGKGIRPMEKERVKGVPWAREFRKRLDWKRERRYKDGIFGKQKG